MSVFKTIEHLAGRVLQLEKQLSTMVAPISSTPSVFDLVTPALVHSHAQQQHDVVTPISTLNETPATFDVATPALVRSRTQQQQQQLIPKLKQPA